VVDSRFPVDWLARPGSSAGQVIQRLALFRPQVGATDELEAPLCAPAGPGAGSVAQAGAGAGICVPPVTVAQLQGALRAAWASQLAAGGQSGPARMRPRQPPAATAPTGRVVMVMGCHGGAGASVVALAVAHAAGELGRRVRLLDCASAERSGLLTAVDAELGANGSGWRRGRRAALLIDRVAGRLESAAHVPIPADEPLARAEVTVVDAGWGASGVLSGRSWLAAAAESAALVLVARPTVPAFRQVEQVLAICGGLPVIAMRGPARWDRSVRATAGRQLLAAHACGRVVTVVSDRHLAALGITSAPLPKAVLEAGRQILARALASYPAKPGPCSTGPGAREQTRQGLRP
jgi:hypothetical protein